MASRIHALLQHNHRHDPGLLLGRGARVRAARAGRQHPGRGPPARRLCLRPGRRTGSTFPDQASGFRVSSPPVVVRSHTAVEPGHLDARRPGGHASRRRCREYLIRPGSTVVMPTTSHLAGRCVGPRCRRVPAPVILWLVRPGAAPGLSAIWQWKASMSWPESCQS
jgi:hypothetical protein